MVNKLLSLIGAVFLSILIAAVYGAIHNQITYSISEEYFTRFKFEQFGLWDGAFSNNNSQSAAFVGVMATWWFGAAIGFIIGFLTLYVFKKSFKIILKHILLTIVVVILFGIIGYIVGRLFINDLGMDATFISSLKDSKAFAVARSVHNFSYLGGLIGLAVSIFNLFRINRSRKSS